MSPRIIFRCFMASHTNLFRGW